MDVGHPVTLSSGAHGIIAAKRQDGVTEVDLLGGSTVRVPQTELKSYFDNPMPKGAVGSKIVSTDIRTDCPICFRNFKTNIGLRIHFSTKHPNDPYPFTMSWYENSQKAGQKKRAEQAKDQHHG